MNLISGDIIYTAYTKSLQERRRSISFLVGLYGGHIYVIGFMQSNDMYL